MAKAILFLLYAALFIFPFGNLFRFDLGNGVGLLPMDVLIGMVFACSMPLHIKHINQLKKDPLMIWGGLFTCIAILSLLFNAVWLPPMHLAISFLYVVRFVSYVNLIWVIQYLPSSDRKTLLTLLGVSGLVTVLFGVCQFVLYPDLRNLYYAGWDEHLRRLFGTALDPNFTGAIYISFISVFLYLAILYPHARRLIVCIMVGIAGAAALTYSRSSALMLITGGSVYAYINGNKKMVLHLVAAVILGIGLVTYNRVGEGSNLLRTASIEARMHEYNQAIHIAQTSPFLGVGFNAYRYAQLRNGFIDFDLWMQDHAGAGVPNSYLFVLATTGLVGLTVYLRFCYVLLKQLYKQKHFILLSLCIGLGVHALFENSLFYPYIMFVVFILKGYTQADHAGSL
jgi:hypothetical protein